MECHISKPTPYGYTPYFGPMEYLLGTRHGSHWLFWSSWDISDESRPYPNEVASTQSRCHLSQEVQHQVSITNHIPIPTWKVTFYHQLCPQSDAHSGASEKNCRKMDTQLCSWMGLQDADKQGLATANWEPATKTISLQIWLNLLVSGNTNWSSSPFSWAQQTFDASTFLFKHLKKSSHSFSCPMRSCHHDNLIIPTASTRISCNDVCCKDSSDQWLADIMPQSSDGKDKYTMHWQTDCNWLGPATHSMMQCIAWCDHPLHAESWDPRTGINISQHNMSRVQFMELNPSIMNNKKNVITCHQLNAQ